jgi:hypothetical protein
MKHKIKLNRQKVGVSRAIDILNEIYPARILQKHKTPPATQEGYEAHIECLKAVLETLDGLDNQQDMRETLVP